LKNKQLFKSIVRYDQLNVERDKKSFSPKQYLEEYYQKLSKENCALLDWYRNIYDNMGEKQSLLEIGGGPTIYQFISASTKVKSITFTDFSQKNLNTLKQWTKNRNSFWDKFIEYSLKNEQGKNIPRKEIGARKKQVASKISKFILMDVGKRQNSFENKFDIVQSNFCLESSTDDISEYKRMLRNLYHYLKKNGILLMVALEGAIVYKVKKKYYPSIYLDKKLAREYLKEAGFRIEKMKKINSENSDSSKYHGFLFIKAIKDK
jgi:hypothetical protein